MVWHTTQPNIDERRVTVNMKLCNICKSSRFVTLCIHINNAAYIFCESYWPLRNLYALLMMSHTNMMLEINPKVKHDVIFFTCVRES